MPVPRDVWLRAVRVDRLGWVKDGIKRGDRCLRRRSNTTGMQPRPKTWLLGLLHLAPRFYMQDVAQGETKLINPGIRNNIPPLPFHTRLSRTLSSYPRHQRRLRSKRETHTRSNERIY